MLEIISFVLLVTTQNKEINVEIFINGEYEKRTLFVGTERKEDSIYFFFFFRQKHNFFHSRKRYFIFFYFILSRLVYSRDIVVINLSRMP